MCVYIYKNTRHGQLEKEELFIQLMVLGVLVLGCLAVSLWVCEAAHYDGAHGA
jgi:hypothetical protein